MKRESLSFLPLFQILLVAFAPTASAGPPQCQSAGGSSPVQAPAFVHNIKTEGSWSQTSWFASPIIADLDGDGSNELIAAYYDVFVFDSDGTLLDRTTERRQVASTRPTWSPISTATALSRSWQGRPRGLRLRVDRWRARQSRPAGRPTRPPAATIPRCGAWRRPISMGTSTIESRRHHDPDRHRPRAAALRSSSSTPTAAPTSQPAGTPPAWPRYNALTGTGNDADRNGQGHHGYGCYGLNVGIGNIDDDPRPRDPGHLRQPPHPGLRSRRRRHRLLALVHQPDVASESGKRLTWGQFIRWADPAGRARPLPPPHRHLAPPELDRVAAVDRLTAERRRSRRRRAERGPRRPQRGDARALRDAGLRGHGARGCARRRQPVGATQGRLGDPAPRRRADRRRRLVPAVRRPGAHARSDISGDARPEIVVSLNDGYVYAFDATGIRLWRTNYRHAKTRHVQLGGDGGRPQPGRRRRSSSSPPTATPMSTTRDSS